MSAIAAIYGFNREPALPEHGSLMMEAMDQYPADQRAVWQKENIMLMCHAQWVTEQSAQEILPYYDAHRGLAITADAIIDNRDELMEQLQVPQHDTKSITDSEILLKAYEKWSEQMVEKLVGDFSFILWDERKQLLLGARDFSGARTLYFHRNKQQLSLCTAINPLLSLPYIKKELNDQWLAEFLAITELSLNPQICQRRFITTLNSCLRPIRLRSREMR